MAGKWQHARKYCLQWTTEYRNIKEEKNTETEIVVYSHWYPARHVLKMVLQSAA